MNTADEKLILRYVDGEMVGDELLSFEVLLLKDSALREEVDTQKFAGQLVRQNLFAEREVPHSDFFQSQLMRRLREECVEVPQKRQDWFRWLKNPLVTAMVGATACAMFLLFALRKDKRQIFANNVYVPTSEGQVKVEGFYDKKALATVVVIDGLPDLPFDSKIGGFRFNVPTEMREHVNETAIYEAIKQNVAAEKTGQTLPVVFHAGL